MNALGLLMIELLFKSIKKELESSKFSVKHTYEWTQSLK